MNEFGRDNGGGGVTGGEGLAFVSLLLGVCGLVLPVIGIGTFVLSHDWFRFAVILCFISPVAGISALICGHLARRKIQRAGKGMNLTGLILGYLCLILAGFLAVFVLPKFIYNTEPSSRNVCINNLRLIDGAKEQWALAHNFSIATGTQTSAWSDLVGSSLYIKKSPACKDGGVYSINDLAHLPTCSIPGHACPR